MSLKNFLSAFVEIDDNKSIGNENNDKKTNPLPTNTIISIPSPQIISTPTSPDMEGTAKVKLHFDEMFQNANFPAPNYLSFKQMVTAMGNLGESATYPAAFAALKIQGYTIEKLISSVNDYIAILDKDKLEFENLVKGSKDQKIQGKQLEIENLKKENEENLKLIQELNTKITANNEKIVQLTSEAVNAEAKINQTLINYQHALQVYQITLANDLEKIKTNIHS